jgi:thioredoxin-like negative regulator of GroEL
MAKPRIFISSTYYDLRHIRASLDTFIDSLGYEPVLSEKGDIAYIPDRPLDESCYREAAGADMLVLIIGGRYGSERSGSGSSLSRSFYERYDSITKQEYKSALQKNIPIYILIDAQVYAEYQTFTKNKDNNEIKIKYAHVDSENVFLLIQEILELRHNNAMHTFSSDTEIKDWLRDQWAGYFRDLLNRTLPTERALETDQKGNVKPPETASTTENQPAENESAEPGLLHWFMLMELAYQEDTDCLPKVDEYYNKCKSSPGNFPLTFIEATYLLARFKCGDSSALSKLRSQGGPNQEAYHADSLLSEYYQSIDQNDEALKYLEYRFEHAPNIDSKLYSALSLALFKADTGRFREAISFLKTQAADFSETHHQADIWETLGKIYGTQKYYTWRKQMCFEKSLELNPDNTKLRFTLAYSYSETTYGKAMAAHHYQIIRKQTPRDFAAANNLSMIYDTLGAVTTKISLLRSARRSGKDNAYVAANLATAYARAGFIADARECLTYVPVRDQQEEIVRGAYDTIASQTKSDREIEGKLLRLSNIQKSLIYRKALDHLNQTDDEYLTRFLGSWLLEDSDATGKSTLIEISKHGIPLTVAITTQNDYYESAAYKVTVRHEPGLLELTAQLDESTLKERRPLKEASAYTRNALSAFGGAGLGGLGLGTPGLLTMGMNRPDTRLSLILVPGAPDTLDGIIATSAFGNEDNQHKLMLDAKEVHLSKRQPTPSIPIESP